MSPADARSPLERPRTAGDPRPTHPGATAALLMAGVVVLVVVLAVISSLSHG